MFRHNIVQGITVTSKILYFFFSEHVRLLEAVEQYGYGNWEDIARHVNAAGVSETGPSTNWSKKNAIQAKEEFCEVFLHSTIGKLRNRSNLVLKPLIMILLISDSSGSVLSYWLHFMSKFFDLFLTHLIKLIRSIQTMMNSKMLCSIWNRLFKPGCYIPFTHV